MRKILNALIVLLIVGIIYLSGILAYSQWFAPKLEYRQLEYTNEQILNYSEIHNSHFTLDRAEVKAKMEKAFGLKFYIYKEVHEFPVYKNLILRGKTTLAFRKIEISTKETKDDYMYAYVLAHEMAHLRYYNCDERYTEFMAIKTLYESGDEQLIDVAKFATRRQFFHNALKDSDCTYYLYNYLFGEN